MSPGIGEPSLKYHPCRCWSLTPQGGGRWLVGSLTGVVASETVTEASKGPLRLVGNQLGSAIAEAGLTVRQTGRSGAKAGYSDPVVLHG